MGEKEITRLTRRVLEECDVYPLPNKNEVEEEVKKVSKITDSEKSGVSDQRIVRRVAKAFELKQKLNDDSWIIYRGELRENRR